jgi:hypothetical protein
MGVGVQVLIGVNSHIMPIFLNAGLVRIGEAGTIEDENQEPINISDILKGHIHFAGFALLILWIMRYM